MCECTANVVKDKMLDYSNDTQSKSIKDIINTPRSKIPAVLMLMVVQGFKQSLKLPMVDIID